MFESRTTRRLVLIALATAVALWLVVPRIVVTQRSLPMMPTVREFIDAAAHHDSVAVNTFAADHVVWARLRDNAPMHDLFVHANLGVRPVRFRMRADTAWVELALVSPYTIRDCGPIREFALALRAGDRGWIVAAYNVAACF
jgi:hypothetical protein